MKTNVTRVEVVSTPTKISLFLRGREIFYEVPSWVNPSCDFALWAALPIAMRYGGSLEIGGATSAQARENAEMMSIIWSSWKPALFRPVKVVTSGYPEPAAPVSTKTLALYSGGVDSTFALKRFVEETNAKPDILTIHGMDYRRDDHDKFEALQAKTRAFREKYAAENILVRSNAASIMRRFGVSSSYGHGFQLFSTLFLFDNTHNLGLISSDFTTDQDYLTLPWGTNTLTNKMFVGDRMRIRTLSNDITRGEKLAALAQDPFALNALSFCKNYSVRPENCGICSKCVRSKAMLHAAGMEMPDIFKIGGFDSSDLRFLDLSKPIEVAFCLDVLNLANASGRTKDFDFLSDQIFNKKPTTKLSKFLRKAEANLRGKLGRR